MATADLNPVLTIVWFDGSLDALNKVLGRVRAPRARWLICGTDSSDLQSIVDAHASRDISPCLIATDRTSAASALMLLVEKDKSLLPTSIWIANEAPPTLPNRAFSQVSPTDPATGAVLDSTVVGSRLGEAIEAWHREVESRRTDFLALLHPCGL